MRCAARDRVQLAAHLVNDEYVWSWNSRVDRPREPGSRPLEFRQSTFQGQVLSPEQLSRLRLDANPALLSQGRATQLALAVLDGQGSLQEAASKLTVELPDQFPGVPQALTFLCSLYGRYWR